MIDANQWIKPYLDKVFDTLDSEDVVVKAASYSLYAGGKRIRPALMHASASLLTGYGVAADDIAPYAACLEMIHTYSLIHDDLPAMDNDDLRRGRATCHKVFGEGIAILAGDMLLNTAHEELLKLAINSESHARASYNISHLAGISGMIGGQSIDIASEGKKITIDTLYELQRKKTGALIEAAVTTPYFISNAPDNILTLLREYACHLGLAFQIKDDILDVDADEEKLGKSVGKDERDDKPTFVTMLGIDNARQKLQDEERGCFDVLDKLSSMKLDVTLLSELTEFNLKRDY
ncbi:MAG: polyprenyl synthetase family protein [Clostridiales bacterium]|nr:polyprenyl synthetase family protein [Clostridiales bacterium]